MRILAVSNYYPPHYVGGYELGCQQVLERLAQRGHEITVLTGTHGVGQPTIEGRVHRLLELFDPWNYADGLWRLGRREVANRRVLRRLLDDAKPEVVLVWSLGQLSNSLLHELRRWGGPVACAVSDYWIPERLQYNHWLEFWRRHPHNRMKGLVKRAIQRAVSIVVPTEAAELPWETVFFTSAALRQRHLDAGLNAAASRVIYWGIDTERFHHERQPVPNGAPPALLFAGRLVEDKGVHTLLDALPMLTPPDGRPLTVSLVGEGSPPVYVDGLRKKAAALRGVFDVRWRGKLPAQEMPALYRAHDVLMFPSIWAEPFSLALLEGMAAGLCVVGTTTGGSAEILEDGVNCLTFPAGDARGLARQLQRVLDDAALRFRLATAGQRLVCERFGLARMVEQVAALLEEAREMHAA